MRTATLILFAVVALCAPADAYNQHKFMGLDNLHLSLKLNPRVQDKLNNLGEELKSMRSGMERMKREITDIDMHGADLKVLLKGVNDGSVNLADKLKEDERAASQKVAGEEGDKKDKTKSESEAEGKPATTTAAPTTTYAAPSKAVPVSRHRRPLVESLADFKPEPSKSMRRDVVG